MTESLTIQMTQRQPARSDHRSKYKIRKNKKRKLRRIYKGGCEKINEKEKGIHQKKKGEIT